MRDFLAGRRRAVAAALAAVAVVVGAIAIAVASRPSTMPTVLPPFADPTQQVAPAGAGQASAAAGNLATARAEARDVVPLSAQEAIQELRRAADEPTTMDIDADGHVRLVAAPDGQAMRPAPGAPQTRDAQIAASAFVNRYGQGFGLRAGQQARATRLDALPGGDTMVRFAQHVAGVPVVGGELIVAVNKDGQVLLATGEAPAAAPVSTTAAVPAEAVATTALDAAAIRLGVGKADLVVTSTKLWLYDPRVLEAPGRTELRPTWWVTVGWEGVAGKAASVLVDALDGSMSLAFSELREAKNRLVCDGKNAVFSLWNPAGYDCSDAAGGPAVTRREGGASSSVADVNTAYNHLGATYDYYLSRFGRDSIDGRGMPLRATVRYCEDGYACPYGNAMWDGAQMLFGQGFATNDVTGHELTHGVTDHTSGLIYFSESGAINESLSDIFGEFLDQSQGADDDAGWLIGEDLPIGAIRSMMDPNQYEQPKAAGTSETYWNYSSYEDNFGVHRLSGVPNFAAYLIAKGGSYLGHTVTGIGIPKTEQIWYRAQFMLSSGAQFPELASILPAACRSIIGTTAFGETDRITAAHCRQVEQATLATNMEWSAGVGTEAPTCPGGQPQSLRFYDDFERSMRHWRLDPNWLRIPNVEFPVSWARSGRGSLDSYFDGSYKGPKLAELVDPVTIPAGTTYVWFATNTPYNPGVGGGGVVYDAGSGWKADLPSEGWQGALNHSYSIGFKSIRYDLTGLAGQNVRLALKANDWGIGSAEWLVDDFMIYQCLDQAGEPRSVAADLAADGTSVDISWQAPAYVGPGIAGYEVTISPTPTGSTSPFTVDDLVTTAHLTGLDPATRYVITVRTIGVGDTYSRGVTIRTPTDPLFDCAMVETPSYRSRSGAACMPPPVPG